MLAARERAKASGASQQKIDEKVREARQFKQMYDNPVNNVALTFIEVFPVGLVVTLASAGILRKVSASESQKGPVRELANARLKAHFGNKKRRVLCP